MWTSKLNNKYPFAWIQDQDGETQKELKRLRGLRASGNHLCADCGSPDSSWASVTHGVFLCIVCSDVHRSVGTHVTKMKGCTGTYLWGPDELEKMRTVGNRRADDIYGSRKVSPDASKELKQRFVIDKYTQKAADIDSKRPRESKCFAAGPDAARQAPPPTLLPCPPIPGAAKRWPAARKTPASDTFFDDFVVEPEPQNNSVNPGHERFHLHSGDFFFGGPDNCKAKRWPAARKTPASDTFFDDFVVEPEPQKKSVNPGHERCRLHSGDFFCGGPDVCSAKRCPAARKSSASDTFFDDFVVEPEPQKASVNPGHERFQPHSGDFFCGGPDVRKAKRWPAARRTFASDTLFDDLVVEPEPQNKSTAVAGVTTAERRPVALRPGVTAAGRRPIACRADIPDSFFDDLLDSL